MRALMRAARSKSSSAAAACISSVELCDELAVLARQEALDALDVDLVLLGRDAAAARAGAEAHVRVEARPRLAVEQRERVLVQAYACSPRQSAHDVAHSGTTRRAMSTMSRAARLSV